MIRQKILQQLLEWIECNLEHPISIEDIAQKSGYSRRNIQLLFRNFMHVPLGEYIRKRRLCRAAILVRLTAKSMLDIALSLHFDSQQSFSREFKKLFGCSPREYRHRDYWDLANIFPSFLIRQQQKTECRLINFPETPIFGNSFKYDIEVSNKSPDEEVKLRRHHLARCMKNFKTDIYFVSRLNRQQNRSICSRLKLLLVRYVNMLTCQKSGQRPEDFMPLSVMKETGKIILTGCVTSI